MKCRNLLATGFIVDPNAPPLAAADDKDGPTKIELHEETPGNFGLQRMGSKTDPWQFARAVSLHLLLDTAETTGELGTSPRLSGRDANS